MISQVKKYTIDELGVFFDKALKAQACENFQEAEKYYSLILQQIGNHADSLHYLGLVKYRLNKFENAIKLIRLAIKENSSDPEMYFNLGIILEQTLQLKEAKKAFLQALKLNPDYALAHNQLSNVLHNLGDNVKADYHCKLAYKLNPVSVPILSTYANLLCRELKFIDAINVLLTALKIEPDNEVLISSLAANYYFIGDDQQAKKLFGQISFGVDKNIKSLNQTVFCANYDAQIGPSDLFELHKKIPEIIYNHKKNEINVEKTTKVAIKIRIAYVSADFRQHSVAYFFLPIIKNHNKNKFEVFCYYNNIEMDHISHEIKKHAFAWRFIKNKSDDEVINMIQQDNIDILVDLSGYSAGSRLAIFSHRVATVQATYLGYPNTSGLQTMDYRMTDVYSDPISYADKYYSEKLSRLDCCFLCYEPEPNCPDITAPPMEKNGYITFGSFNNMAKQNIEVITVWSKLLAQTPGSRILLKSKALADDKVKRQVMARFEQQGIDPSRLILESYADNFNSHIACYNAVDIALDPFPYTGTTTTLESLWMGVPVVTLCGETHRERVSASILHSLELDYLIANSHQDYLKIAMQLGSSLQELKRFRHQIRDIMINSTLLNGKAFTYNLESQFKMMLAEKSTTLGGVVYGR